ncbi:MAG: sigma 54-interacting transcriptional regulator [Planctomycetes bacterium]|nr:sigma 54-interacting transcriptional regulator [Planctomycetota bacterium]
MKVSDSVLQAVPAPAPAAVPEVLVPKRAKVADLRRMRDRLFRDGRHDLALQAAAEVAARDPGRESFLRHGMMLQQVGRYREALGVLRDALRFETGPKYLVPDIHLHLAYTWFLLGKRKRMSESLKRAYALRLKPRTAFNFHQTYGNFLLSKNDYRGALLEFRQAEKSGRNVLGRGRAAMNQAIVLIRQWDFAAASCPADRALRMLKRAGHAAELAIARSVRGSIYDELGQHRRAFSMMMHAYWTYRRLGKVDRQAEALAFAGYIANSLRLWSKSLPILDRAISLASTTGQQSVLCCAYANRAIALAFHEDLDRASASLAQAQRLNRGRRDWIATLHICRAQARISGLMGKWNEVVRVSRRAERLATKVGDALRVVEFRRTRAEAEARLGRRKASSYAHTSADRIESLLQPSRETSSEQFASRLALSEMPILIFGKEGANLLQLARRIHESSSRAKGPCVVVPCEHLKFPASDLYGHAEGAWSGATRTSKGYVSGAQGGTLILDRVDQLAAEDQPVLLALFDRKARAVGDVEDQKLDLRVVATATNLDRLSRELRLRLEGAVIEVPSLEDRKSDIPHLVTEALGGRRKIAPDALAELARHSWHGDLAELCAVVERLVAFSNHRIGRKLVRKILMTPKARRVADRVHISRASSLQPALTR